VRTLVVVLMLFARPLWAQAPSVEAMPAPGARVVALDVEGAKTNSDRDSARAIFGIEGGDAYDDEAVRAGIRRVFLTGPWADVRVYAEPLGEGVRLILVLVPDRVITDVEVETTGIVPRDRLRGVPTVGVGDRFREEGLEQSKLALTAACRALGYPRADVSVSTDETEDGDLVVRFRVIEGSPLVIGPAMVIGQHPLLDNELLDVVGIKSGAPFDRLALDEGLARLVELLVKRRHLRARAVLESFTMDDEQHRATLTLKVDAGPRYGLVFFGNQALSTAMLKDRLPMKKIGGLDDSTRDRVEKIVERVYQEAGFALADARLDEIDAFPPYDEDSTRLLRVTVDEGPRARVTEIVIEGAQAKDPKAMLDDTWVFVRGEIPRSSLLQRVDEGDLVEALGRRSGRRDERPVELSDEWFGLFPDFGVQKDPLYLESIFTEAGERIADTYRTDGFLAVDVIGPELIVMGRGEELRVRYRITEGPQTRVVGVRFTPAPTLPLDQLLVLATFEPGTPANLYAIEETRASLERKLREEGFPQAVVGESLETRGDGSEAEVVFTLDEGPRVRVGQVRISGNKVTHDVVIEDRLTIAEGDWFRTSAVEQSRLRLMSMGLFSSVSIELARARPNATVQDVVVIVRERSLFSVETGAGASIEDGPRAFVAGEMRNVFGLALGLRGRAQVNYPYVTYGFVYREDDPNHPDLRAARVLPQAPLLYHIEGQTLFSAELPRLYGIPFDTRLHIDAIGLREIRPAFTLLRGSILFGVDVAPFKWWRGSSELEGEMSDFDCPQNLELGQGCGAGSVALTRQRDAGFIRQTTYRLSSTFDLRDDPFRPHKGVVASASGDVAIGSGFLRTGNGLDEPERVDSDFVKLSGYTSGYVPLASNFTVAMTLRAGNIFPILSKDNYVPLYKRFYLGGTSSVRGFFPDQILPADDARWPWDQQDPSRIAGQVEDENGTQSLNSLGGNFFVNARSELRIGLVGDLELGVFIDGGQLLNDPRNFAIGGFAVGAGVGVRYNTPVGPFVIDLGWRVIDGQRRLPPLASVERLNVHFAIGTF
jgi:outer membrane protein insertion porin family